MSGVSNQPFQLSTLLNNEDIARNHCIDIYNDVTSQEFKVIAIVGVVSNLIIGEGSMTEVSRDNWSFNIGKSIIVYYYPRILWIVFSSITVSLSF